MTADAGIGPKYRPSRESADCQFIRKSSPCGDDAAALPDGKQPTPSVALARRAHRDRIDHDREPFPADGLPGKRQDVLQHGNAARQIVAVCEEGRERLWRQDGDQFGDVPLVGGLQPVETHRHTCRGVPHVERKRTAAEG